MIIFKDILIIHCVIGCIGSAGALLLLLEFEKALDPAIYCLDIEFGYLNYQGIQETSIGRKYDI